MEQQFDINKFPENGYLIFPLSMSRLKSGQSPQQIYDTLVFFNKKIPKISLDVIFVYTNGLYMNSDEKAIDVRTKTNNQMLNHRGELWGLILKKREFVPQAFHFLTWDYMLLNAEMFPEVVATLKQARKKDLAFQRALDEDLGDREKTEVNFNFLLEEISITHLLRQKLIPLPHALTPADGWRLIVYHGSYIKSDAYAYKKNLLPKNKGVTKHKQFSHAHYDSDKKVLIDFDKL